MSTDYNFTHCYVNAKFVNPQMAQKAIEGFNKAVADWNDEAYECGDNCVGAVAELDTDDKDKTLVRVYVPNDIDDYPCDIYAMAKLICTYFPNADGEISEAWACVSAGGYTRSCGGRSLTIKKGVTYEQTPKLVKVKNW